MNYPEDLKYTKDHEWLSIGSKTSKIGVSSYAIEQLGDVVHVELPTVGTVLKEGDAFGTIESTKTVSDLYSPCSGKIVAVNEGIIDEPELLVSNPYAGGWLIEIEVESSCDDKLMSSENYINYLKSEH